MSSSKRPKKLSAERDFLHTCRDGTQIRCCHLRKKRVKNLYLKIERDGGVSVTTPWRFGLDEAVRFVAEKEEWILKRLLHEKIYARTNPTSFHRGCEAWYLGKKYGVEYENSTRSRVDFKEGRFLFRGPESGSFDQAIERFYLRSAKELLSDRVDLWSEKMELTPSRLNFRRYKSRWGSCSADNTITLNSRLMRYDIQLIDYVIVHELAHIRYKHHRKEFWKLVEMFIPDYRELGKRLV